MVLTTALCTVMGCMIFFNLVMAGASDFILFLFGIGASVSVFQRIATERLVMKMRKELN